MNNGILEEILSINQDITDQYMNSNFPYFIKKHIANKNRKKLRDMINNRLLDDDVILYDILKEYLEILYLRFPPNGAFLHIASVKKSIFDNSGKYIIASTISYNIPSDRNNIQVVCDLSCVEGDIKISYRVAFNSNPSIQFSDSVTELRKVKIDRVLNEYSKEYIALMSKNTLIDSLNGDIKECLLNALDQSEQIESIIKKSKKQNNK